MFINEAITNSRIWKDIRRLWQRYRRPFLIFYLYALTIYLPLLILRLTNHIDGLWNQDDYAAGTWELSIGRWFWPYLDRARFNLSLDPLPGVFSLALYVTGFLLIVTLLKRTGGSLPEAVRRGMSPAAHMASAASAPDRSDTDHEIASAVIKETPSICSIADYLSGFLFLAGTAITCQMSHGYMVITFAVSFLLSVLAVYVLIPGERSDLQEQEPALTGKRRWIRIPASGILIALMMGTYQAGIGTTCIIALFCFMNILSADCCSARSLREALRFAMDMLSGILIGAALYEILLHLNLAVYGVELSSYQGFSEIGPSYFITHLGTGIRHAYQEIGYYFFSGIFKYNILETHKAFRLVYLVPAVPAIYFLLHSFRNGAGNGILYTVSLLLVPVFAGSFYLLAPEAETHMQMLISYSLIIPIFLQEYDRIVLPGTTCRRDTEAIQDRNDNTRHNGRTPDIPEAEYAESRRHGSRWNRILSTVITAAFLIGSFFLIYGAIFMNEVDQYAMYAGRRATSTLAENILAEAQALGQDPVNGEFEIIGVPARSPLFSVKDLYYEANSYAQYGNWSEDVSFARVSWSAMYRNYLRTNVSFAAGDTEQTIAALPETAAVPVFPAAGSIQNIYGVTVIRVSASGTDS